MTTPRGEDSLPLIFRVRHQSGCLLTGAVRSGEAIPGKFAASVGPKRRTRRAQALVGRCPRVDIRRRSSRSMTGMASRYEFSPIAMALVESLPYFRNHSGHQTRLAERIGDRALIDDSPHSPENPWTLARSSDVNLRIAENRAPPGELGHSFEQTPLDKLRIRF